MFAIRVITCFFFFFLLEIMRTSSFGLKQVKNFEVIIPIHTTRKKYLNKLKISSSSQIRQRTEVAGQTTAPNTGETDRLAYLQDKMFYQSLIDLRENESESHSVMSDFLQPHGL